VNGSYVIDEVIQSGPGQPLNSQYSTIHNGTRNSGGRLRYRAHLGWDEGGSAGWGVDTFMNYNPHWNTNGGALPPLCFLQGEPSCAASGMPQYAQYTQQFPTLNNLVPGMYTFDLSVRYNTGDMPLNRYLKDIQIVLSVNNLFDRQLEYAYGISNSPVYAFWTPPPKGVIGFGSSITPDGRYLTLTITKTW
jgi:hypothetical protein